jgi:hypothetical protein
MTEDEVYEEGRCRSTASKPVLKVQCLSDGVCNQRLKLQYEELLSNFAFNFNLRRCNEEAYTMVLRLATTLNAYEYVALTSTSMNMGIYVQQQIQKIPEVSPGSITLHAIGCHLTHHTRIEIECYDTAGRMCVSLGRYSSPRHGMPLKM